MYSEFGQDDWVVNSLAGHRDGYFIEAGALDGIGGSNTLRLEREFGWRGLCVEANDRAFAQLVRNRTVDCVHACLHEHEGTVDFVENALSAGGILSEYHPLHLQWVRRVCRVPTDHNGRPLALQKVTRTLGSLLEEYSAPRTIDYCSLDTEGSELAILRSFPFGEYRFRILTVEHCWIEERREGVRALLERQGYGRVDVLGADDCYVPRESMPVPAWRSATWRRSSL